MKKICEKFNDDLPSTPVGEMSVFHIVKLTQTIQEEEDEIDYSGSTAVVLLIRNSVLYVGHVGDSRLFICNGKGKSFEITKDHKPYLPEERERIEESGGKQNKEIIGWVNNNRLNGVLGVSRSIGDVEYKILKEKAWRKVFKCDPLVSV